MENHDLDIEVTVENLSLIHILVGFDAEGKIYNYSLLAHTETPGLGSKADKWFGAYDPAKGEQAVSHELTTRGSLRCICLGTLLFIVFCYQVIQ